MNEDQFIQQFYNYNKELYKKAKSPLRSHGPDHHLRVCKHAINLARKLEASGEKVDYEILIVASLLHDLAAYYPEESGEKYHDYDHLKAKEVLLQAKFNPAKIDAVLNVIANHGSDPKYKDQEEAIEVTILRDADKLDVFGPLGIARIIMVRTLKGDSLPQIVDDFYTRGHLERKWQSITTKEAKEMCQQDYNYAMEFLKRLSEQLSE